MNKQLLAQSAIDKFKSDGSSKRVLVIGDSMLDSFMEVENTRTSPEANCKVYGVGQARYYPGGAANAAMNLSKLGLRVELVSILGEDANSIILSDLLTTANVSCKFFFDPQRPTTVKTRVIEKGSHLLRIDVELCESIETKFEDELLSYVVESIQHYDALLLSDYAKGLLTPRVTTKLIESAISFGIPVVVDPKGSDFSKYQHAQLITPNLKELGTATGIGIDDTSSILQAIALLTDNLGSNTSILLTKGAQGMTLFTNSHEPLEIEAIKCENPDVTGAGDCVAAVMVAAIALELLPEMGATLANLAAGFCVSRANTYSIEIDDISRFFDSLHPTL